MSRKKLLIFNSLGHFLYCLYVNNHIDQIFNLSFGNILLFILLINNILFYKFIILGIITSLFIYLHLNFNSISYTLLLLLIDLITVIYLLIFNNYKINKNKIKIQIIKNKQIECIICFDDTIIEEMEYLLLPCNHIYHKKCLLEWFDFNKICPKCRKEYNDFIII